MGEDTFRDTQVALREVRAEKETVWGKYLLLQERERVLEARAAELADRSARDLVRPPLAERVRQPYRPRVTVACRICEKAVRRGHGEISGSGLNAICNDCLIDEAFSEAMEQAVG